MERKTASCRFVDITVPQVRARCAFAFVLRFHFDKAVGCAEFGILLIAKETESVLGKDRILDRAICRTKRSEAVLLLHVLRNLEAAHCLNLPLRRSGPDRVRSPDHVVSAKPLDQRP